MSACAHKRFGGDTHVTTHCQPKPQIVVLPEVLCFVESSYFVNQATFGNDGRRGDDSVDANSPWCKDLISCKRGGAAGCAILRWMWQAE